MMLWLVGAIILMVVVQKFVRKWFFQRVGRLPELDIRNVLSPVDGVVVYVHDRPQVARKRWDLIDHGIQGEFWQIGIYMSGYDRHIVTSPVCGVVDQMWEIGADTPNVAMIDFWNFVKYYYLGITPKLVETEDNYSLAFKFLHSLKDHVYMVVIADKFVGHLKTDVQEDMLVDQSRVVVDIRRGSQVDVFVPVRPEVKVGDQLRIGDKICSIGSSGSVL